MQQPYFRRIERVGFGSEDHQRPPDRVVATQGQGDYRGVTTLAGRLAGPRGKVGIVGYVRRDGYLTGSDCFAQTVLARITRPGPFFTPSLAPKTALLFLAIIPSPRRFSDPK